VGQVASHDDAVGRVISRGNAMGQVVSRDDAALAKELHERLSMRREDDEGEMLSWNVSHIKMTNNLSKTEIFLVVSPALFGPQSPTEVKLDLKFVLTFLSDLNVVSIQGGLTICP